MFARAIFVVLLTVLGTVSVGTQSFVRTVLSTSTTFVVDEIAGTDPNPCTAAQPCKSFAYAIGMLLVSYDFGGQDVTIQGVCNYTPGNGYIGFTAGIAVNALFVGQNNVIFRGNPANSTTCLIQPHAGDCVALNRGAIIVTGFWCDHMLSTSGQGAVSVGQGGNLSIGIPGDASAFAFGAAINPMNDITVSGPGSQVYVNAPYSVYKVTTTVTASWAGQTTTINVSTCNGFGPQWVPHLASGSPLIPARTVITSCSGGIATLNAATTGSYSGPIEISQGGQNHIDVSNGAALFYATNCGQAPFTVTFNGHPAYYDSFIKLDDLSSADLGATYSGQVYGIQYDVERNSVLNACAQNLPGTAAGIVAQGGQVH